MFAAGAASRGAGSRRINKRGSPVISRRAGTAGTGGALSLSEWHTILDSRGIVPYHLSKVDAIYLFSNSRRSNLSIKCRGQGNKMNELRVALRGLAEHLNLKLGNMPLPVFPSAPPPPPRSVLPTSKLHFFPPVWQKQSLMDRHPLAALCNNLWWTAIPLRLSYCMRVGGFCADSMSNAISQVEVCADT